VAVQWIGNPLLEAEFLQYSACRECSWDVLQRLEPALNFPQYACNDLITEAVPMRGKEPAEMCACASTGEYCY